MAETIDLTDALRAPITTRPHAEAFIAELHRLGLLYHFEDDAADCLEGLVTPEAAEFIGEQVEACYEAWRESGADLWHDCPIGHALKLMEADEAAQEAAEDTHA